MEMFCDKLIKFILFISFVLPIKIILYIFLFLFIASPILLWIGGCFILFVVIYDGKLYDIEISDGWDLIALYIIFLWLVMIDVIIMPLYWLKRIIRDKKIGISTFWGK